MKSLTPLIRPLFAAVVLSLVSQFPAVAAKDDKPKSSWLELSSKDKKQMNVYIEDYKTFIHKARTELSFVEETVKLAKANGFKRLTDNSVLKPGARFFDVNRDRAMTLMVIGKKPVAEGLRIVGSHIDSPRIELKGRPLYEKQGFALFQTYVHGGIKNYQWVNVPLALVGRVDKTDGTVVNISIGLNPGEPVLMVPDLAPHVDRDYRKRTSRDVIKKEELDVIIASKPGEDSSVKDEVIAFLKENYDISIKDLVSAELSLVPAMAPRDVGFDRSMVAAYGQDDKLAAYGSVRAVMQQDKPEYTSMAFLVDNEEVGNINNTGAKSTYLTDLIADLLYKEMDKEKGTKYSDHFLRKALRKTKVISTDVNPGVNPTWSGVWELGNAPRLGM
ncbi:MAG: aminopeptidase 1, partial [Algicola sp.]|nr:aminopeptidase 1 [Algicola sp.]